MPIGTDTWFLPLVDVRVSDERQEEWPCQKSSSDDRQDEWSCQNIKQMEIQNEKNTSDKAIFHR